MAQEPGAAAEGPERQGHKQGRRRGQVPQCLYALPACPQALA